MKILLDILDSMTVCCGNVEEEYLDLIHIGGGPSNNTQPGIIAYREGDSPTAYVEGARW